MSNDDLFFTDTSEIGSIDFAKMEEVSRIFQQESEEILSDLDGLILSLEKNPADQDQLNILFRKVHTIKGSVGAVPGGQLLGSLSHEFESLLMRYKQDGGSVNKDAIDLFLKSSRLMKVLANSLYEKRELYPEELSEAIELISAYGVFVFSEQEGLSKRPVSATHSQAGYLAQANSEGFWLSKQQLDDFLKISGELIVLKNFFSLLTQTVHAQDNLDLYQKRQKDFEQNLGKISDQLHVGLQDIRKESASTCFQRLPVLIRQASTELNKPVQFTFEGSDTLIDKSLGHDLQECLIHMIRNSIDHGIEDQFERALQGKSSLGNLYLSLSESASSYKITYRDDGKGLDRDKILEKALGLGLVLETDALNLTDSQIFSFIFEPGFSTKDRVTTMSGRGVGMDVVQTLIAKYQGRIDVKSEPNTKTEFLFEIPIPKHIMVETALVCSWNQFQFAVPLDSIASITTCAELKITYLNHLRYCQFKDQTLPLLNYHEICHSRLLATTEEVQKSSVLILQSEDSCFGLIVDQVEAQADLVLKDFSPLVKGQKGCKGLSILADDRMAFLIDTSALVSMLLANPLQNGVAA